MLSKYISRAGALSREASSLAYACTIYGSQGNDARAVPDLAVGAYGMEPDLGAGQFTLLRMRIVTTWKMAYIH